MTTIDQLSQEIKELRKDLFRAIPPKAMNPAVFVKVVVTVARFQAACSAGPAMGPPPPA